MTEYWFARYKYGSRGSRAPLQRLITDAGVPDLLATDVAKCMGRMTWSDVSKAVLRVAIKGPSGTVR